MIRVGVLAALVFVAACARAPKPPAFPEPASVPSIQAIVSTTTPRVGDVVDVDVRVNSAARLVLPPWEELLHPEVRLLSAEKREDRERLRVALYSVTNVTLFAQTRVKPLNESSEELELPFVSMEVRPTLAEGDTVPKFGNDALPDFRGPEALRRFRRNLLLSLVGLLVVIALVFWASWRISRRPPPPPPPPDYMRIALEAMDALRGSEVWRLPDPDAVAVRLSAILRAYIEGRFAIHAPELTTEEFLATASANPPWPESDQASLARFFTAVDRIKFAAERPGRGPLEELMRAAESFVRGHASGGAP